MSGWSYAFSLTRQQVAEAEPPGTARLVEHEQTRDNIQLIPHPSQSRADPLNWPAWRKACVLMTMCLFSAAANFASASIAPSLPLLQYQILPPRPLTQLSHLVAVNVLLIGTSNIFWVPLSNTFGRRPVLLFAMLLGVFSTMWGGLAKSFGSLLAARAVQGAAFGPADAISPDVVGEIYFVHQRGRVMAIYTFFLAGGSLVGGVAGSYIAASLGYRYIFWISTALLGFVFLLQVFLVPETLFDRQAQLVAEGHPSVTGDGVALNEKTTAATAEHAVPDGEMTLARTLKVGVWRGDLVKHFLDPWRSLAFPGTWVVLLHYGGLLGGLVSIATVGPIFLAMPPYLWGKNVGLLGIGAIVGCVLGFGITYLLADGLLTRRAKHESHGLAEPESRLPAMFPALFIATCGIWTFGFSAAHPAPHAWAGLVVGFAMVGFGITVIPSIGFNYLLDSYFAISADCFVMTTISRAVISFAWTFFVTQWIETAGASLPFGIFGMLMGVFSLFTIPLWLFGKRMRIATAGYLPKHENH